MPISIGVSGVHKQWLPGTAVGAGGVWKAVVGLWIGAGGVWKNTWVTITATLSPTSLSGTRTGGGSVTTTGSCTCTGSTGGGTYSWVRVSGPVGTSADSPTSATTTFSRVGSPASSRATVWRCDYTLSGSTVSTSNTVAVTLIVN